MNPSYFLCLHLNLLNISLFLFPPAHYISPSLPPLSPHLSLLSPCPSHLSPHVPPFSPPLVMLLLGSTELCGIVLGASQPALSVLGPGYVAILLHVCSIYVVLFWGPASQHSVCWALAMWRYFCMYVVYMWYCFGGQPASQHSVCWALAMWR